MTNKLTIVIGYTDPRPANWESMSVNEKYESSWSPRSFHRNGFWRDESILAIAHKKGFVGSLAISYNCMDYSGKGRSYVQSAHNLLIP